MDQLGERPQEFRLQHSTSQISKDIPDGQACIPHTGLTKADHRVNDDALEEAHALF